MLLLREPRWKLTADLAKSTWEGKPHNINKLGAAGSGPPQAARCLSTNLPPRYLKLDKTMMKEHVQDLADKMFREQEDGQQETDHGCSSTGDFGNVLLSFSSTTGALKKLKQFLPQHQHKVSALWDPEVHLASWT